MRATTIASDEGEGDDKGERARAMMTSDEGGTCGGGPSGLGVCLEEAGWTG